eukprot:6642938-Pyramimonas_sp.AAC.1
MMQATRNRGTQAPTRKRPEGAVAQVAPALTVPTSARGRRSRRVVAARRGRPHRPTRRGGQGT